MLAAVKFDNEFGFCGAHRPGGRCQGKSGMYGPIACCLLNLTPNWLFRNRAQSLRSAGVSSLRSSTARCLVFGLLR